MDRTKLKQAIEFAKQNPDSDYANELRRRIESGQIVVESKPNYLERVVGQYSDIGERTTEALKKSGQEYIEKAQKGDIVGATGSLLRSGLRSVGAVTEGAFAPITEAPIVKDAFNFIGEKIGNTELGQRLAKKIQENPETAQDIMDIVNTLTLGGGKAIEAPAKYITGETLQKTGSAIEKSGLKALKTKRTSFIRDLVKPEQTKAVKEAQVGRTVEKGTGVFKRSEILPTEQELRMEKAISSIPEVKSTNTFQQNYNIIKEANTKEAQLLEKQIADNDFIIPKKEIKSRLVQAKNSLAESPLITGDAEKMADKLLTKANQLVDSNAGTGSGLLKARKEFDAWVLSQKPKAFDATAENAFSIANREVRNTFNQLLDEKAIDVGVKESLSKQSNLYMAMDNIAPKAAQEADTAIARAFNNMAKAVGIKNKAVQQIATIAGIGGLGAAATFAPAVAIGGGLAFLGYKGARLVMKPEIRVALGKLLQKSGKLLNPEDKAILENAIKTYSETPNKQGGFVSLKGKGTIPENSLISEAKKYKSVEEFVKEAKAKYKNPTYYLKSTDGSVRATLTESELKDFPRKLANGDIGYYGSKKPQGIKSLLDKTYNTPDEVPQKLYNYIQKNQSLLTSDANDATRLSRIINTLNDARYPNENITIFRAVDGNEIRPGDWVSTDIKYAQEHLTKNLKGKGKIVSEVVNGRDVLVSPTGNAKEAIFAPRELSYNPYKSQLEDIWKQANNK